MTVDDVRRSFTDLTGPDDPRFDEMAEVLLRYQRSENPVYGRYCAALGLDIIAYLPVSAFKERPLTTFRHEDAVRVFESSGTGRGTPSRHYFKSLDAYDRSVTAHFERVFGAGPFTLLAHLPHYAAMGARSSLVYMMDLLIRTYGDDASGFFLDDLTVLDAGLRHSTDSGTPLLLFGAAFGLLDLAETRPRSLPAGARIIETGGMKTYRRAITRDRLHAALAGGFGMPADRVWSEYGMCELSSQAYTRGGGVFHPPPWMRFRIADPDHPLRDAPPGLPGVLAVLDLANVDSVAAVLTEDRAVEREGGFEVLGRLSGAELRGCNFLLEI